MRGVSFECGWEAYRSFPCLAVEVITYLCLCRLRAGLSLTQASRQRRCSVPCARSSPSRTGRYCHLLLLYGTAMVYYCTRLQEVVAEQWCIMVQVCPQPADAREKPTTSERDILGNKPLMRWTPPIASTVCDARL